VSSPQVTIVTPVYNRPKLLARALASLQRQSLENFECIVIDDASEASPADIVEGLDDPRFRLIQRAANGGPVAARMSGLREARGAFIASLDSDNEFFPWALERAVSLLNESPGVGCATGLYVFPDGLRVRVSDGKKIVSPDEYRRSTTSGDSDGVGIVRRQVMQDWLRLRDDFYALEFHLVFWMSLHYSQLYVDEPWGVYHTDADDRRASARRDDRDLVDIMRFVNEYRPVVGRDPCVPLDEYLKDSWFRLRRANRTAELKIISAWMRERGLTEQEALTETIKLRLRQRFMPRRVRSF
jgi:glycosyltransferase involved in cell wall biosynthesis